MQINYKTLPDFIDKLKYIIQNGNTKKAIDFLVKEKESFSYDMSLDIVLISNRFSEYSKNNINGFISLDNLNIELRNINKNLLSLIQDLPHSFAIDEKQLSDDLDFSGNNELIKISSKDDLNSQIILICGFWDNQVLAKKLYDFLKRKNLIPVIIDYTRIKAEELLRISIKKAIHFIILLTEKQDFISKNAEEHFLLAMRRNDIQTDFIIPIKIGKKQKYSIEEKYKLRSDFVFFVNDNIEQNNMSEFFDKLNDHISNNIPFLDSDNWRLNELVELEMEESNKKYLKSITSYNSVRLLPKEYVKAALYSFCKGNLREALIRYNHALNSNFPRRKHVLSKIGACLIKEKDYVGAEMALKEAINRKSDYPLPHYNLGILYKIQKKYDEALVSFQRAITLGMKKNLTYYIAHINEATTHFTKFKLEEKNIELFQRAKKILEIIEKKIKEDENIGARYTKNHKLICYNLTCMYSYNISDNNTIKKAYNYFKKTIKKYPELADELYNDNDLSKLRLNSNKKYDIEKLMKEVQKRNGPSDLI